MKRTVAVTTFSLTLMLACLSVAAQTQSRDDILKEIQAKRAELSALENKFLEPSDADRQAYASFLSEPNTGMIRLLPREKYDVVYNRATKALNINGGGAFYCFARSTHEYGQGSDIYLENGQLGAGGAGFDHGFMLNLGDVPLQQLTVEHQAVRALLEFQPALKEIEIRKEQTALHSGVEIGGYTFKSRWPAKASNTYLLRSLNYEGYDIAVAFRLVREDADGSFIVLFNVLKRFPVPKAERIPRDY